MIELRKFISLLLRQAEGLLNSMERLVDIKHIIYLFIYWYLYNGKIIHLTTGNEVLQTCLQRQMSADETK